MLTADLVAARRSGGDLRLAPSDAATRARIEALAEALLELARAHVGRPREALEEAWATVEEGEGEPRQRRLAAGVRKLVEDRCLFEAPAAVAPAELRRALFERAAAERRELPVGTRFDRQAVLQVVADALGLAAADVEAGLYADLRGAERLRGLKPVSPRQLAESFDLCQAQAVLLRAVRVTVRVQARDPGTYRALFHKLKFLRLLHTITAESEGGYRVEIDGPFSLFQAVTKYGLQLGLALPAIAACDRFQLEAVVLWGRDRQALKFRLAGGAAPPAAARPRRAAASAAASASAPASAPASASASDSDASAAARSPASAAAASAAAASAASSSAALASLTDEVKALMTGVERLGGPWRAAPSAAILDLPGVGLCVPDLVFTHALTGEAVFLEVLGFWSRAAVWRRVDLVRAGLPHRILFAVSKHLRVSEEVLGDDLPGALYVYARTMSASAVVERLSRLVDGDRDGIGRDGAGGSGDGDGNEDGREDSNEDSNEDGG